MARGIVGVAALTALAADQPAWARLAELAAVAAYVLLAAVWAPGEAAGAAALRPGRRGRAVLVAQTAADLVVVGLVVAGAAHYRAPGLAPLAAIPVVVLHARRFGRDRGLVVAASSLALAIGAALIAPHGHVLDVVEALGAAAVLAWTATTVARLTDSERQAAGRSLELDEFRRQVMATVSHEVRTPLTLIQGLTTTLASRWDQLSEPQRLDLVDVISLNVASLDSSILHFVDAARVAKGGQVLDPDDVELAAALDAVELKLSTVLAGHTIHRTLHVDSLWADADALAQIYEHLLTNAVRFSPLGTPIFVRVEPREDWVELAVADRGRGIPEAEQELIWEPLWRGDVRDTGVSRGAGLGLFIVRQLAEAHGGKATVASSGPNSGTTIVVTFPYGPAGGPRAPGSRPGMTSRPRALGVARPVRGRPTVMGRRRQPR